MNQIANQDVEEHNTIHQVVLAERRQNHELDIRRLLSQKFPVTPMNNTLDTY